MSNAGSLGDLLKNLDASIVGSSERLELDAIHPGILLSEPRGCSASPLLRNGCPYLVLELLEGHLHLGLHVLSSLQVF